MLLGKCLVFHLKYLPEMKRLLEEKSAPGTGRPDEETMHMVREVGNKSKDEAVAFLQKCGQEVEKHAGAIGAKFEMIDTQLKIERRWALTYGIAPRSTRVRAGNWKMKVGIELRREKNELVMWVERQEDRNAAAMAAHLKSCRSFAADDPEDSSDTIVLARMNVLPPAQEELEVDSTKFVEGIAKAIQPITGQVLEMVYPH